MKRTTAVVVLALACLFTSTAEAQKRCVKGIPCGGTCISAKKTCRIGAPPKPAARTPVSSAPAVKQAGDTTKIAALPDTAAAWVGSSRGHTYYRAGCRGAVALSPANLITFKSEAAAIKAGYVHSRQKGC